MRRFGLLLTLSESIVAAYKPQGHLFPGSTALTFDYTEPLLESISVTAVNEPFTLEYRDVQVRYFRRIPVSIHIPPRELDGADTLSTQVQVDFLDKTDQLPILLFHKKFFGGNHAIWYDTSNFCDWVERHGSTLTPPLHTGFSLEIRRDKASWEPKRFGRRSGINEDYVLYIGFPGKEPTSRRVSFRVQVLLNNFARHQDLDQDSNHPCHLLERNLAPHFVHSQQRSRSASHKNVFASEIVIRKWAQLSSAQPENPKLVATFTYTSSDLILLGVDFPELPKNKSLAPLLVFEGLHPRESSLLLGSYGSRSIWEFQKLLFTYDPHDTRRLVALPLTNILSHLAGSKSLIDPPGSTILLAIVPRKTTKPEDVGTSFDNVGDLRQLSVYPAILNQVENSGSAPIFTDSNVILTSDTSPKERSVINMATVYAQVIRAILYTVVGASAIFGISHGFCLVLSRVSATNASSQNVPIWLSKQLGRQQETRAVENLEEFYQRSERSANLREDTDDRSRLLAAHSVQFDIASAGGDSHR